MKTFLSTFVLLSIFIAPTFACPKLEGHYTNCKTEVKKINGEYFVSQYNDHGVEVYQIRFVSSDGEIKEEEIRTDNIEATTKQTIPTIGVTVNVVGKAHCENQAITAIGKAYFWGANVGTYNSTIFMNKDVLTMKAKTSYLGKNVDKLIECKE